MVGELGGVYGDIRWIQIDIGEDAEDVDHDIDDEERLRIVLTLE